MMSRPDFPREAFPLDGVPDDEDAPNPPPPPLFANSPLGVGRWWFCCENASEQVNVAAIANKPIGAAILSACGAIVSIQGE